MTHSDHFLSRLDRLSSRHTEEALLLYNDAPLLRSILELARVPAGAGRVALALDEGGPYVVVTRDGHFVTCLAAGMTVVDLPIVSRRQLDGLTCQVGGLRALMELARSLTADGGGRVRRMLERMVACGAELSREEFRTLALLQPVMLPVLVDMYLETAMHMCRLPEQLAQSPLGPRSRRLSRARRGAWEAHWLIGHLTLLLAHEGPDAIVYADPEARRVFLNLLASAHVVLGGTGLSLRGIWAIGRLGKDMLALTKERMRTAGSGVELLSACLSLLAIGARHAGLCAEVLKCLASSPERFPGAHRIQKSVHEASVAALRSPAAARELAHAHADAGLQRRRGRRGLPAMALPDDLFAASLGLDIDPVTLDDVGRLPALVVAIARLPAEELYAPRAHLEAMGHGPWSPALSARVVPPAAPAARPEPRLAPATPGRNDACPCGRGRKFKKCCGAAASLLSAPPVRQPAQTRQHGFRLDALPVGAHGGRADRPQRPLVKLAG